MAKKQKKGKGLWAEFKEFINKGNAFMLAVAVVIGGAFSAIVNAVVDILLSLCTAALPGGLSGFVTVIHTGTAKTALEEIQKIYPEAKMELSASEYLALVEQHGQAVTGVYTKFGGRYVLSTAPVLNWGALINAVISFLIIAVVLFIIVKIVNTAARKREELKAKALEEYYAKHPEERPVPPEPGLPEPTEVELLKDILATLKKKEKASK